MIILSRILLVLLCVTLGKATATLDLDLDYDKFEDTAGNKVNLSETNASFSEYEQKLFAKEFIRQVRSTGKMSYIPSVNAYIQNLGKKFTKYANQPIRFFVLNNDSINAFAGLGGVIGVHTGLILLAEDEGELAGVLAHEVAHVTQHHIKRLIELNNSTGNNLMQALLVSAAIIASGSDVNASQAAILSAVALPAENMINYTRLHEAEADAIGLRILLEAGYQPNDMISMFRKLLKMERFSNIPPEFLRTHPLTDSRITMLQNISGDTPVSKTNSNNDDFFAIQAILKLHNRIKLSSQDLKNDAGKIVYAINLFNLGDKEKSKAIVSETNANAKTKSVYFKLLVGQYFALSGDINSALIWYQKAYQQKPNNLASIVRLSKALLRNKEPLKAKLILNKAIKQFNNEPEIYRGFADFFASQNKLTESYYWNAWALYLSGYTKRAIVQLRQAQKRDNGDRHLKAKIEAKINEYQNILELEQKPI